MTTGGTYNRTGMLLTIVVVLLSLSAISCTATLYGRASRLQEEGRYNEAISVMQKVLAIEEEQKGAEHQDTATALNKMAELYRTTGAYAQAEPLYQRSLAILEKVLGPEHPATATALNNLAVLYGTRGAYGQAELLYQRSLAILEKVLGPEHPTTATALNNLAVLYRDMGAYTQAEPLYQRVLAIREKVLGPEHPDTATALNNLAELYGATGAYTKAEPLVQRALAIKEKVLGPEHLNTAASLYVLALLSYQTGAYAKAEPLYQRVLAIREKVLGLEHPETAQTLNGLATLYASTEAYAKAEPLYQRTLTTYEKVQGPEHPDTAAVLNNLALMYHTSGAYAQAELLYQRALAIMEKVPRPEHPDTAQTLNNLAVLYGARGAYAQAEPLYQRSLAILEKVQGPENPDTAKTLANLAALYWANGDLTRVLPLVSRVQSVEGKNLSTFFLSGSESRKQAYLARMRSTTSASISLSLLMPDRQARILGFQSVLTVKGRVLDAMSESTARLRESMKPEDRAVVDELMTVAQQRSTLTYQGIGNLKPEVYRQRLQELVTRQEQLEADLSTRSAEFQQTVAPITLAAVQTAIPEGMALIEWYRYKPFNPKANNEKSQWGRPRYVAYVLKHDGEAVAQDIGDAEAIGQLVHDFRTGLSDRTSTYVKDVAKELYEKLLKPLQPHLGNAQQLLLSPDGALNLVPFSALIDESGAYLGSKKSITYLTSGRDLLRFGTKPVSRSDMVVVANPDYGPSSKQPDPADSAMKLTRSFDLDREGITFKQLPGTAEEAETLKGLLKITDDNLLTQAKATEHRFKQLNGPRILHVATHGFFLRDNELPTPQLSQGSISQDKQAVPFGENPLLRSGLALAGANQRRSGEKDDGILTAAEVAQMDLRGTQLVVLSACETGVGDVQNGEGVYGLRRALVLAGAESQVTSLWQVADDATKDLMVDYYQRLLKGEGRSEALRNAQLTMMKSKDRSHPYYWAAFVPIGDWRPLAKSN